MITLIVNNSPILLGPDETVVMQKAAAKIGELQNRQGSYTNDFAIPATSENLKALGYANLLDIYEASVLPGNRLDSVIYQEGIEFARGSVQIVSADYLDNTVTVAFFGGLSDWVSKLSGKAIQDIDLSRFNHIWNVVNIENSWSNTDGYIYPFIDHGRFDGLNSYDLGVTDFYPALYQKEIIKIAFSEIGYKLGGSFIDEFPYQRAIIPFANKEFLSSPEYSDTFVGSMSGQQTFQQTTAISPVDETHDFNYLSKVDNQYAGFNIVTDQFTANKAETYKMRLEVDLANIECNQTGGTAFDLITISIRATDGGTVVFSEDIINEAIGTGISTSGSYVFEFDWTATAGANLATDVRIQNNSISFTSFQYILQFTSNALYCDGIDRTMAEGDTVEMGYILPDIQILDLIKDMVQRHGLIVGVEDYTQTVTFDRFEKMTTKDAVDWSDKIDISRVHTIDFSVVTESYSKSNILQYAEPDEDDTELTEYGENNTLPLGAGTIEIANDWVSKESTLYQSIYKATAMRRPTSSVVPLHLPYLRRYNADDELAFAPGARVLYVIPNADISELTLSIQTSINWNGGTVDNVTYAFSYKKKSGGIYDNLTDSLLYGSINEANISGVGLIETNYTALQRILNGSILVEVSMQLREHEFANLDFSVPVYIDAGFVKGYWFIDEILDYEGGMKPCRARLIRL